MTSVLGPTGQRARALTALLDKRAAELGVHPDQLVSRAGLLRLLDQRPTRAEEVWATTGALRRGDWAAETAAILGQ